MSPQTLLAAVYKYEGELRTSGVPKKCIDPTKTFLDVSADTCMAHAHALCGSVREALKRQPNNNDTAVLQLREIQMCLSFAGLLPYEEMVEDAGQ